MLVPKSSPDLTLTDSESEGESESESESELRPELKELRDEMIENDTLRYTDWREFHRRRIALSHKLQQLTDHREVKTSELSF